MGSGTKNVIKKKITKLHVIIIILDNVLIFLLSSNINDRVYQMFNNLQYISNMTNTFKVILNIVCKTFPNSRDEY